MEVSEAFSDEIVYWSFSDNDMVKYEFIDKFNSQTGEKIKYSIFKCPNFAISFEWFWRKENGHDYYNKPINPTKY